MTNDEQRRSKLRVEITKLIDQMSHDAYAAWLNSERLAGLTALGSILTTQRLLDLRASAWAVVNQESAAARAATPAPASPERVEMVSKVIEALKRHGPMTWTSLAGRLCADKRDVYVALSDLVGDDALRSNGYDDMTKEAIWSYGDGPDMRLVNPVAAEEESK